MNSKTRFIESTIFVLLAVLVLAGGISWVLNIVKIIHTGFDIFTGLLIARCIGVFVPPLGVVLGFL